MTSIGITPTADGLARLDLVGGLLAPRVIGRGPDSATVALVATGALLLGGDRVDIAIEVGDGCSLELIDIGGTVAYDAEGQRSFWNVTASLGRGARLFWNAKPLIVATGADVHRTLQLDLAEEASAVIREVIVLGRTGEAGGRLHAESNVQQGSVPVFVEQLEIAGDDPTPGVLGDHRVLDTVFAFGFWPVTGDALLFDHPGGFKRYLGPDTHSSPGEEVWARWKGEAATTG